MLEKASKMAAPRCLAASSIQRWAASRLQSHSPLGPQKLRRVERGLMERARGEGSSGIAQSLARRHAGFRPGLVQGMRKVRPGSNLHLSMLAP